MSSQGPATGTATPSGASGCFGNTQNSQVPGEYTFSKISIRDSSDWIAYKKQTLILQEDSTKLKKAFPEISYGNDYRIQYLLGKYKNSPRSTTSCDGCADSKPALLIGRASDTTPPN
jgi:hypothetical protein